MVRAQDRVGALRLEAETLDQQRREEALATILRPRIVEDFDCRPVLRRQAVVTTRLVAADLAMHGRGGRRQRVEQTPRKAVHVYPASSQVVGAEMQQEIDPVDSDGLRESPRRDDVVACSERARL